MFDQNETKNEDQIESTSFDATPGSGKVEVINQIVTHKIVKSSATHKQVAPVKSKRNAVIFATWSKARRTM